MEQFNLDKWLKDKSRKVVTRDGRNVRIICWDAKNSKPIVALVLTRSISRREFDEHTINYYNNGTYYGGGVNEDFLDLFFADEEEELTDFEKHVQAVMMNCGLVGCTKSYKDIDAVKATSKHLLDLARKEIEEGEQKSVDEVNPKFKAGDWVVCEVTGLVYQIENCILNTTINKYGYDLTNGDYISSGEVNHYHLWTIQDTKDGDVLVTDSGRPFIFKGLLDRYHPESPVSYCGIAPDNYFDDNSDINNEWWTDENVYPATEEQHDLLFQKMKEAGYEWNAKNKELKKIEQKPAWSEEDERHRKRIVERLEDIRKSKEDNIDVASVILSEINWLKSLKFKLQNNVLENKKPFWHSKHEEPNEDRQILVCVQDKFCYVDFYHSEDKRFYMFEKPKHYLQEIDKWLYIDELLENPLNHDARRTRFM